MYMLHFITKKPKRQLFAADLPENAITKDHVTDEALLAYWRHLKRECVPSVENRARLMAVQTVLQERNIIRIENV